MGIGLFLLNLDILQLLNNVLRFTSTIVVCADIKIIYIIFQVRYYCLYTHLTCMIPLHKQTSLNYFCLYLNLSLMENLLFLQSDNLTNQIFRNYIHQKTFQKLLTKGGMYGKINIAVKMQV